MSESQNEQNPDVNSFPSGGGYDEEPTDGNNSGDGDDHSETDVERNPVPVPSSIENPYPVEDPPLVDDVPMGDVDDSPKKIAEG